MIAAIFLSANPSSLDILLPKVIMASTLGLQGHQRPFYRSIAVAPLIYTYFQELKAANNSIAQNTVHLNI